MSEAAEPAMVPTKEGFLAGPVTLGSNELVSLQTALASGCLTVLSYSRAQNLVLASAFG
jgi:hypothetical protein